MKNKISVLMSLYKNDQLSHFKESVNSILKQTYTDFELIIIQDGFVEKEIGLYLDELAKVTNCFVLKNKKNIGLAASMNYGLQYCNGDFIARMDADDIAHLDRLELQMGYLLKNDLDICACLQEEFIDDPNKIIFYKKTPETHEDIKKALNMRCVISHPSILVKKSALVDIGGYKIDTGLMEDYDLHMRLIYSNYKYGCIQKYLISVRISPEQRQRRGGISYVLTGLKLKWNWYQKGYISLISLIKSSMAFTFFTSSPASVKKILYSFVREKNASLK